jgi:hypothetical protein
MRLYLFVFSAGEVLLWLVGTIILYRQQRRYGPARYANGSQSGGRKRLDRSGQA